MKNNLIPVAILATLASTSALADVDVGPVQVYGTLATAIESITLEKGSVAVTHSNDSQSRLQDQTSKLGVKGKFDLGDGLSAVAQVESRVFLGNNGNATDDKAEIGSRNTFAGLTGASWGTVRLGRYDNAYKLGTKQQSSALYNTLNDATGEAMVTRLGARQGDVMAYESPNWSGFNFNASYNLGKDSANSISGGSTNNTAKNTVATDLMPQLALGVGYAGEGFSLGLAYSSIANASWKLDGSSAAKAVNVTTGSQSLTAMQLGGQYNFGPYSIGAVTERTESSLTGVGAFSQSQNVSAVVGGYKNGAWELQLRYAQASDVEGSATTATNGNQLGFAAAYQLGKNARFVSSFTQVRNGQNANFSSGSGFSLDKSVRMTQLALGISVSF